MSIVWGTTNTNVERNNSIATPLSLGVPTGAANGSRLVLCCQSQGAGVTFNPTGGTGGWDLAGYYNSGNNDRGVLGVYTRIMDGTEGTVLPNESDVTERRSASMFYMASGFHASDVLDLPFVVLDHASSGVADPGTYPPEPITTVSANASVFVLQGHSHANNYISSGPPVGYTKLIGHEEQGGFGRGQVAGHKTVASPGTETPGNWQDDGTTGTNYAQMTLAFKAEAAAAGPTITEVNNGNDVVNRSASVPIVGVNFGTTQGTVTYNGVALSVLNWTDTLINVSWPDVPFTAAFAAVGLNREYPMVVTDSDTNASPPFAVKTQNEPDAMNGAIAATLAAESIFTDDTYPANSEAYGRFDVLPDGTLNNPGFENSFERSGGALTGKIWGLFDPSALDYAIYDGANNQWSNAARETFASSTPTPPVITNPIPDQTVRVGLAITSIDLVNHFSGATSYTADTLPSGITLVGSVISGTPTDVGQKTTVITATNAGGSVQQTFNWDVFSLAAMSAPGNLEIELAVGNAPIPRADSRITDWLALCTAVDDDGTTALTVSNDWNQTGTVGAGTYPVVFSATSTAGVALSETRQIIIYNNGQVPAQGGRSSPNLMVGIGL